MITPQDIQNKEFTRGVRGYKEEEVDAFLDEITIELEKIQSENRILKEQASQSAENLEHYRAQEGTLLETLEAAKALMSDISASSEKRAKILLKNAELDAELMQKEAKEAAERLTNETAELRNQYKEFRSKFRSFLEAEMLRLDSISESDLFGDRDMEELKTLTEPEK